MSHYINGYGAGVPGTGSYDINITTGMGVVDDRTSINNNNNVVSLEENEFVLFLVPQRNILTFVR